MLCVSSLFHLFCFVFSCFFFSLVFILFRFLVHAMDTTPIVKTIQNNGKNCSFLFLVYWLPCKLYINIWRCYYYSPRFLTFVKDWLNTTVCPSLCLAFADRDDSMTNVFHVSVSFLCVFLSFSFSFCLFHFMCIYSACLCSSFVFSLQINELMIINVVFIWNLMCFW